MQSLETYISEFKQASSEGDWDAIAVLQGNLKEVVESASKTVSTEQEQQAFIASIKTLSELVKLAVEGATSARHQVADQLHDFARGQAAVSEYSNQSRR